MSGTIWPAVISRLMSQAPVDLDSALGEAVPVARAIDPGRDAPPPSALLWARDSHAPAVGIRLRAPLADPAATALRLASAAEERRLTPVILSTLPRSGLERFGFRVERLLAGDDVVLSAQEAELARFWDMVLIVDAEQLFALR